MVKIHIPRPRRGESATFNHGAPVGAIRYPTHVLLPDADRGSTDQKSGCRPSKTPIRFDATRHGIGSTEGVQRPNTGMV